MRTTVLAVLALALAACSNGGPTAPKAAPNACDGLQQYYTMQYGFPPASATTSGSETVLVFTQAGLSDTVILNWATGACVVTINGQVQP